METNIISPEATASMAISIPSDAFLEHWQGHRRLSRRMIEAFPEEKLFTYSIGGMRPFSALAMEMIGMADAGVRGLVTRTWLGIEELAHHSKVPAPSTKEELLRRWDEVTETIDTLWPQIEPGRFEEVDIAFGQYEGPVYSFLQYWIDNEVHHRGQGYVYLRSLGIEPPYFWVRE
jgi:uncharacterized damage-inducible protein DinB